MALRQTLWIFAAIPVGCTGAYAQDSTSVPTVSGVFRGTCAGGARGDFDRPGEYRYTLGGRTLPSLNADCFPGSFTSNVSINEVWRSRRHTTVLMTEGISAVSQTVRLIHFRVGESPLAVDLFGHDITSKIRLSETEFRLVQQVINMARDTWDCEYDINFGTRIVSSRLMNSQNSDITAEVCEAEITEVALGPPSGVSNR